MTVPVAILQHGESAPPGWLSEVLAERRVEHAVIRLDGAEPLPVRCSAVVSLGGEMSAHDEDASRFVAQEKRFLRSAVADGLPVLGICLGCQLLADALGGRAFPGPRLEAGYVPVRLTAAGREDPVLRVLGQRVLSFHFDTWQSPPGARLLAESDHYPQAFRLGTALGVQFHPEAQPDIVVRWVFEQRTALRAIGIDPDALTTEVRRRRRQSRLAAHAVFGAWVEHARLGAPTGD